MNFDQQESGSNTSFGLLSNTYCSWLQRESSAVFFLNVKQNMENKNPAQQKKLIYTHQQKWQNRAVAAATGW